MSLLSIDNLSAAYGEVIALDGVSINIDKGAFCAVIGANTAGKSTLLRCISGLVGERKGSILFNNTELIREAAHKITELGIAHVPEGRHVFPNMSVETNLRLGAFVNRKKNVDIDSALEEVYEMFPVLRDRKWQSAGSLSGGEQQMVALGRALMLKPRLLMLDEPSHGLAPKIVQELHDTLTKIHKTGLTILLVEQNTQLALSVADNATVLQSGKVVMSGPTSEMLNNSEVRKAYLGI